MKLSFEQIKDVSLGCASIEMHDSAIRFHRIPKDLGMEYENSEGARIRRDCPASVRLRFRSNSRTLKTTFTYGKTARQIYQAACIIGNDMFLIGSSGVSPSWSGEIPRLEERHDRLFELWLPSMAMTDIVSIELEDDSTFVPAREYVFRWLAYGDSITQGMTVPNPAENHVSLISRKINADVWNMSVGGAKMEGFLSKTIPSFEYDIATVAYGVNDFNSDVPLSTYMENSRAFFTALLAKRPNSPIVAISPIPFLTEKKTNSVGETLDDFRDGLTAEAGKFKNVIVADGRQLVPAEVGCFVDGCHPNAKGARLYAENLMPIMLSCIKSNP